MKIIFVLLVSITVLISCTKQEEDFNSIEITRFGYNDVTSFFIDDSGFIFEINKKSNKVVYFQRQLTKKKLDRIYKNIVKLDSLDIDKNFNGVDYDFYSIKVFKKEKEIFSFQELYNYKPSPTKNDSLFNDLINTIEATKKNSALVNFSKYQNASIMFNR